MLWDRDYIESWSECEFAHDRAQLSFDSVANNSAADASADGVAHARVRKRVRVRDQMQEWGTRSTSMSHHRLEVTAAPQTLSTKRRRRFRWSHQQWELDGQPGSAACASASDHVATVLGRHAGAKPVLTLTGNSLRLPCSLGHWALRSGAANCSRVAGEADEYMCPSDVRAIGRVRRTESADAGLLRHAIYVAVPGVLLNDIRYISPCFFEVDRLNVAVRARADLAVEPALSV